MAISSLVNYRTRRDAPWQRAPISKAQTLTTVGKPSSTWISGGQPVAGATPSAAVAPTSTTQGALGQYDSAGTQRILRAILSWAAPCGMVMIADRLSHTGGLDGTSTAGQTTNLPTAALTRQTSGVGVLGALETYVAIGATGSTVSASYTNQAGTSGQATPATTFGGAGSGTVVGQMVMLPLAAGDTGIKAVASVTIAGTTGTVGNFGVTLFYPLVTVPFHLDAAEDRDVEGLLGLGTWFPKIVNGACLFFVVFTANNAGTGIIEGELKIGED